MSYSPGPEYDPDKDVWGRRLRSFIYVPNEDPEKPDRISFRAWLLMAFCLVFFSLVEGFEEMTDPRAYLGGLLVVCLGIGFYFRWLRNAKRKAAEKKDAE